MKICGKLHNIEHIEQKEQLFTTIFLSVYNGCKTLFFQFYLFAPTLSCYLTSVRMYKRTLTVTTKVRPVKVKHD